MNAAYNILQCAYTPADVCMLYALCTRYTCTVAKSKLTSYMHMYCMTCRSCMADGQMDAVP